MINYNKRMQSTDSTETYVYGMRKCITYVIKKIKRYNIIKKRLTSIMSQKKTQKKLERYF